MDLPTNHTTVCDCVYLSFCTIHNHTTVCSTDILYIEIVMGKISTLSHKGYTTRAYHIHLQEESDRYWELTPILLPLFLHLRPLIGNRFPRAGRAHGHSNSIRTGAAVNGRMGAAMLRYGCLSLQ